MQVDYKTVFYCIALSILFLVTSASTLNINAQTASAQTNRFNKLPRNESESLGHVFRFIAFGRQYDIKGNGRGLTITENSKIKRFKLELDEYFYIETLSYYEYRDQLILVCEVTDAEAGGGAIYSLNQRTLLVEKREHIPGFNIGDILVEEHFAYITACGFISKVNLRTGKYVWKPDGLYKKYKSLYAFEIGRIDGNKALFTSARFGGRTKTIVVNKNTGKIVEMKD